MKVVTTFDDLIGEANQLQLYTQLVKQLNKDLALANVSLEFDDEVLPTSLKLVLHEKIYELLEKRFMEYLNLLYIIDVSEKEIKQLDGTDLVQMAENVTFLILKREWQKVYYRSTYPS